MKTSNKNAKTAAIPRGDVYLDLTDLFHVFWKILTCAPKKGEKVKEFENAFGKYYAKSALALPYARIALYYILKNLNLPAGSEVIMTPLTIADMVNMIHLNGLRPVFCDLGKQTYNADYDDLEKKITDKTKVLFVTHLNGFATDMEKIMEIAESRNLIVIEDCSQAFGAKFKGQLLGTFGRAGIFSLSLLKTCSTLFGGMIISEDIELIEKIKKQTENFPPPSRIKLLTEAAKNIIIKTGFNKLIFSSLTYHLIRLLGDKINKFIASNPKIPLRSQVDAKMLTSYTDIQARLGLKKLKTIDAEDEKRIQNAKTLYCNVSEKAKARLPYLINEARNVYWRMPVRVKDPERFIRYMLKRGIDTCQTNLVLCSREYKEYKSETPEGYLSKYGSVFMPIHSNLNSNDMISMAQALNEFCKE